MRNLLRLIFELVFLLLVGIGPAASAPPATQAQCELHGGTWDTKHRFLANGYCVLDNENACKNRGGKWTRVCLAGALSCVISYSDGHKACTDGSQCMARLCLYRGTNYDAEGNLVGSCKADDIPCGGGGTTVKAGKLVTTPVAD